MGTVTAKSGDMFSGVFAGATTEINESTFMFKMVRQISSQNMDGANGANEVSSDYIGTGPDHTMVFGMGDIIDITIANVSTITSSGNQNGNSISSMVWYSTDGVVGAVQGFRTDSDISGGLALRERDLQRWEAPAEHEVDMSKESIGVWDQFAANERFGGKSNYHEELYTTPIDRTGPLYRMRELEAERKVREIEDDFSANPHVREERGLGLEEDGADEEERYTPAEAYVKCMLGEDANNLLGTAEYAEVAQTIPFCNPTLPTNTHLQRVELQTIIRARTPLVL